MSDPTLAAGTLDAGDGTLDAGVEPVAARPTTVVLPDRYRDLGRIASGGFGEVRRVEDRHLGSVLAMKILKVEVDQPEVRRRFEAEARLTARLHHPGIVSVQDLGTLADGRTWYTMEEVRGETLTVVIEQMFSGRDQPDARWTLRRVVEVLMRASQAVASAHATGLIHRDLKPDNVMVGAYGEVRVMDWGLARGVGRAGEAGFPLPVREEPLQPGRGDGAPWLAATLDHREVNATPPDALAGHTVEGRVMGTPAYMPPEQARGALAELGPPSDVYALGAMLYTTLAGRPPYPGDARAAWLAVLAGPPAPLPDTVPAELAAICARAMARDARDRHRDADAFAADLAAWLEGARRRAEAEAFVSDARARLPVAAGLRAEARALAEQGRAALAGVAPSAPTEEKLAGWRLEAAAKDRLTEARRIEAEIVRDLRAALAGAPELVVAHETLADLYRERLEEAEHRGDADAVAEYTIALETHDRGRHRRWLAGNGAVTLVTDPPGAHVEVLRYEERDRRLVPVPVGTLGPTPIVEAPLPRGSYLLIVRAPGRVDVRYPVQVGRLEHWDGVRPGDTEPHPIVLPQHLGPDDCYVPAGWFWSGGDERALDGLPRRRLWVDALVMRRFPVTNRSFLAFIQDIRDERWVPRDTIRNAALYSRDGDVWGLPARRAEDQDPARLDEPVAYVDVASVRAFCAWEAARTGTPWRLPHDQEWEKAARGVDARAFPWGHLLDPSWTRMQLSHVGVPGRADVTDHPLDESPYGVRGLGGNVRDWCTNAYDPSGSVGDRVVVAEAGVEAPYLLVRGGSMSSTETYCRSASRMAWNPSSRGAAVGFRLAYSVTDPTAGTSR